MKAAVRSGDNGRVQRELATETFKLMQPNDERLLYHGNGALQKDKRKCCILAALLYHDCRNLSYSGCLL
jgi:hypothetical protein